MRECRSLSQIPSIKVTLAAPGNNPGIENLNFLPLGKSSRTRIGRLFSSQMKAIYAIFKLKSNVWHIHDPELLPIAALLIIFRKKVIWDSHEDYFKQFELHSQFRTYIPRVLRKFISYSIIVLLKFIDKHASGVIAATDVIQKKYSNGNCYVVGNEARSEDFEKLSPIFENKSVLFVGSMSESHCFKEVVQAVSKIEGLDLVVAGVPEMNQVAISKGILGERIRFVGWATRSDLFGLISNATIGMVTYQNLPTYHEARPTKLFEFMMSGLPVVASPTKINSLLLDESKGGVLSEGFEPEDYEKSLREILTSKETWSKMSEEGRRWALLHGCWDISERELFSIYSRVVSLFPR